MVRLYKNHAQFLILLLAYMRDELQLTPGDIVYRFRRQKRSSVVASDGKPFDTRAIADRLEGESLSAQDVTDTLLKQVYGKDPNHDGDLVDLIVNTLELEYARNRLSSGVIEELRRAILLPDELRKVKEALTAKELRCTCGHRYNDGELTTLSVSREGVVVRCARCQLPQVIACQKQKDCDSVAVIDERDLARMKRATCRTHKKPTEQQEDAVDPMTVQEAVNGPLRTFQQFAMGRSRPASVSIRATIPENLRGMQWEQVLPTAPSRMPRDAETHTDANGTTWIMPSGATFTPSTGSINDDVPEILEGDDER